jgi:hypothetical protein
MALPLWLLPLALATTACEEEFSDDQFGVLDLASLYDGGTSTNPVAGLPGEIVPTGGYLDGESAEYYNFGAVPFRADPKTGVPLAVPVQPMYFFFRSPDGVPLFSRPVRQTRDGTDWMPGGRGVLNPNPKDFCAGVPEGSRSSHPCERKNQEERRKSYPTRQRDPLVDPVRGAADYQRPIIDVTPANRSAASPQYTGLWEIVEVLAPAGYRPDSIKHAATLEQAVASGKFKRRHTGKVINCPLVDERTYVATGTTNRPLPRPRIDVWYRRKVAQCYLANGWETLGNDQGEMFYYDQDEERIDTFDVIRLAVGEGTQQQERLMVPVAKAYSPSIYTFDPSGSGARNRTDVSDNFLARGRPRHLKNDPPGYTPMRWMHELRVPSDYQWGALTSVDQVDPSATAPFRPNTVSNVPLRGVYERCGLPETTKAFGKKPGGGDFFKCGTVVELPNGTQDVDGTKDPKCNALGLHCNPYTCYCDLPFAEYGEACGPSTAQCKFIQYQERPSSFSPQGLFCFPPWGGRCHLLCDAREEKNARAMENVGKKPTEFVDSRCKEVPGMQCVGLSSRFGVCLKFCDQNVSDPNQCGAVVDVEGAPRDINEGQTCQDWGLEICTWPETYGY